MKNVGFMLVVANCFGLALTTLGGAPALAGSKGHMSGAHMFDKGMQPILASYLKIQSALASDSTSGVKAAAQSIVKQAKNLDAKSVTGEHANHYKDLPQKISDAANAVAKAAALDAARESFKELSKPMAMWGTMSKPASVSVVFCSMAKGSWLQKSGDIRNPYYGKSMLACGEVVGGAGHGSKGMDHSGHGGH